MIIIHLWLSLQIFSRSKIKVHYDQNCKTEKKLFEWWLGFNAVKYWDCSKSLHDGQENLTVRCNAITKIGSLNHFWGYVMFENERDKY